jgi:hypothetical protein
MTTRRTTLEERGRFQILEESAMAWADWEHIPKAPVGCLAAPAPGGASSSRRSTASGAAARRSDAGARSRATSRSSTPAPSTAYAQSEPGGGGPGGGGGGSAQTSPGGGGSAHHGAAAALAPEAMAAALKQFRSAYAALHQIRAGLGGVGRALGLPAHPLPQLAADAADAGAETASQAGAMDPKPPQGDGAPPGGGGAAAGAGGGGGAAAAAALAASVQQQQQQQQQQHQQQQQQIQHSLLSPNLNLSASATSLLLGESGVDSSERSLKSLYEEAIAAKRKLVQELKAAREEAELLKNKNTVLQQRIMRAQHPA